MMEISVSPNELVVSKEDIPLLSSEQPYPILGAVGITVTDWGFFPSSRLSLWQSFFQCPGFFATIANSSFAVVVRELLLIFQFQWIFSL